MCFCTFKRPGITDGNSAAYGEDEDENEGEPTRQAKPPTTNKKRRRRQRPGDAGAGEGEGAPAPLGDGVIGTRELKAARVRRRRAADSAVARGEPGHRDDVLVIARRKKATSRG